jgi:hypothetical protein
VTWRRDRDPRIRSFDLLRDGKEIDDWFVVWCEDHWETGPAVDDHTTAWGAASALLRAIGLRP